MEIVLVRHGETEWSRSGQHTSRTDLPLIEEGRERALALPGMLAHWDFSLVLTSPLLRARQTCELAGFADRAVVCDDLREWDYGDYEGLTTPQIREQRPGWSLWQDGCPNGEQPDEVGARADRALDRLRAGGGGGGSDGGSNALAFAHGHIFRVIAARWIELPALGGARLALRAGAVCALGFERDTHVIQLWNDAPR